jgi:hypothetical protein
MIRKSSSSPQTNGCDNYRDRVTGKQEVTELLPVCRQTTNNVANPQIPSTVVLILLRLGLARLYH